MGKAMAMQFRVRWFDPSVASVQEELAQAESRTALMQRFAAGGQVVLSVQRERSLVVRSRSTLDVAWWCRELRTLLAAGMTVVEALETLQAQPLGQARADVHAALVDHLRQGRSLSVAMQEAGVFPGVLVAGVKASELTSGLVPALDDYLRYHDVLERLRKQVVSAAIYPMVVMALGSLICVFLLLFVIPRFSRMYGDLHGPVSLATRVLVAISRGLSEHSVLLAGMLVGLVLAVVAFWRGGHLARFAMWLIEAVPSLRRRVDEFRLAKLYQSLALMFRGGYSLDAALGHCVGLGLGERLADNVRAAQQTLSRGQRVSSALSEAGLTDAVSQRLLAVGERTGNFDRVLQTIADRHAGNFTTFIERATRIVEPVLLLVVALVVGGIVVAMYMPVFDIASSVR